MEKFKYQLQKIFLKGGIGVFLSLAFVFIGCYFLIVTIRFFLVTILPESEDIFHDFAKHMWVTYLAMTDPGNMNQDNDSHIPFKVTAILAGFLGVVIFSTVIAFITTTLEDSYYRLRKGRNKFLEKGHTVILGWNDKIADIIRELVIANESQKYASIVILAPVDKQIMDELIEKEFQKTGSTSIFVTSGNTGNLNELNRINAHMAKSIIILASCNESDDNSQKELSDINNIKTILALYSCQGNVNKLPIIIELFQPKKADLLKYFNDDKIIALENWRMMGKLLLQSSITAGLVRVYDEILSFKGNEIYIIPYKKPKIDFYELSHYYMQCIPIGLIKPSGQIILRPTKGTIVQPEDDLVLIAEDDSSIKMLRNKISNFSDTPFQLTKGEKKSKRLLILGWHEIAYHFMIESKHYFHDGSTIDVAYHKPNKQIISVLEELKSTNTCHEINLIDSNPFVYKNLEKLSPFSYDIVIILPQNINEPLPEKNDTDTLIILMMLRQIRQNNNFRNTNTKIISQVLDSDNQDLMVQIEIDDFITSNKLITMIIAQLSEQPRLKLVYEDMFRNEGSEIYIKPLKYYVNQTNENIYTFMDLMDLAYKRDEICLGICINKHRRDLKQNFGVILNPPKTSKYTLNENDSLIVLSEDDT